ncbi:MAG: glycosyltransferase family 2 protein [Bdellovibrionales bacterium]|nr:glycosyltransferase family 2 protein [Bdellovibrionales bacterium]
MKVFGMVTTAKSEHYTDVALKTFFETTKLERRDLFFLIDNDQTFAASKLDTYPQVNLIVNNQPLSFSSNANQMVDMAMRYDSDLYFMNNDVVFTSDWLEPLMVDRPAILSPLCNREIQYQTNVFTTKMIMELDDYLSNSSGLNPLVHAHRQQMSGYLKLVVLPFFCVKIPLPVLRDVGHFDEDFGKAGGEDYDYCLRALLSGYSVEFARQSYLLHFGGKSSWAGGETREEQDRRELHFRSYFAVKWGIPLLRLILLEDPTVLDEVPGLRAEIEKGNQLAVVQALRSQNEVAIKL